MAKDKKKPALAEGEEAGTSQKKSKKKLIIFLVLFLLLLGGIGAGATYWFVLRNPGSVPQEETASAGKAPASEGKATSATEKDAAKKDAKAEGGKGESASDSPRVERPAGMPRSRGVVLPLRAVTVNLTDQGGRRYLKLGMEVEANKDISKQLEDNEARIRDAIIMLLAGRTSAELMSPDGKVMLKAAVANRLNQILGEQRIIRVYFTDFVVQ